MWQLSWPVVCILCWWFVYFSLSETFTWWNKKTLLLFLRRLTQNMNRLACNVFTYFWPHSVLLLWLFLEYILLFMSHLMHLDHHHLRHHYCCQWPPHLSQPLNLHHHCITLQSNMVHYFISLHRKGWWNFRGTVVAAFTLKMKHTRGRRLSFLKEGFHLPGFEKQYVQ